MDRSLENEVYSFISDKAHNNEYYFSRRPLLKIISYAWSHGIPVWTESKWLDFLLMKDESSFLNLKWSGKSLIFSLD